MNKECSSTQIENNRDKPGAGRTQESLVGHSDCDRQMGNFANFKRHEKRISETLLNHCYRLQ